MEELVKQAKMGNDEAFTQLIIQMQCEMFRIAQTRLKNIDDANDAIQQTNLYAYKNLRQLKEDKYFKTWIIKILINDIAAIFFISPSPIKYQRHSLVFKYNNGMIIIIE